MPSKPKYGEIICSALLDGWLIHGSTYDHKDMIKEHGGKWFGKCKGWALNDKSAVARILKEITLPKKLEKVKNSRATPLDLHKCHANRNMARG